MPTPTRHTSKVDSAASVRRRRISASMRRFSGANRIASTVPQKTALMNGQTTQRKASETAASSSSKVFCWIST
jgi:hypothetical protein